MATLSIRQRLHAQQDGLCAYCHRPLSVRGAHRHHLIPGNDGLAHRVLVHPACHRKIHGKKRKRR
jgi:RNA-directed DNA polymerase